MKLLCKVYLFIRGYLYLILLNNLLKRKGLKSTREFFIDNIECKKTESKFLGVDDIARVVQQIINLSFKDNACLEKSFLLYNLLQRHGYKSATLYIGIRNMQFEAHAWVVYKGKVVGDYPYYVKKFVPIYVSEMR